MSLGKAIRLFLVDGVSTGLLTAEITNWTGHVLVCPRSRIQEAFKRDEAVKTGLYLLIGEDNGRPRVYVGEGDCIADRVRGHARDEDKQFWERVLFITSKDYNLTKAHVRFLESKLVERIRAAGRAECMNGNQPAKSALPEADISDMSFFLTQLEILLPTIGADLLRMPKLTEEITRKSSGPADEKEVSLAEEAISLRLSHPKAGVDARGFEFDGEVTVLRGPVGSGKKYAANSYASHRQALIEEGKIRSLPSGQIEFLTDVTFRSPSAAAAVLNNCNSNGRTEWKLTSTGMTLGAWWTSQLERAEITKSDQGLIDSSQSPK